MLGKLERGLPRLVSVLAAGVVVVAVGIPAAVAVAVYTLLMIGYTVIVAFGLLTAHATRLFVDARVQRAAGGDPVSSVLRLLRETLIFLCSTRRRRAQLWFVIPVVIVIVWFVGVLGLLLTLPVVIPNPTSFTPDGTAAFGITVLAYNLALGAPEITFSQSAPQIGAGLRAAIWLLEILIAAALYIGLIDSPTYQAVGVAEGIEFAVLLVSLIDVFAVVLASSLALVRDGLES